MKVNMAKESGNKLITEWRKVMVIDSNNSKSSVYKKGCEYTVGQRVLANDASEFDGLIGTITQICVGENKDTDNDGPEVHVDFDIPDSKEIIADLEERFSRLYQDDMSINDICLDDVILSPEMIIVLS